LYTLLLLVLLVPVLVLVLVLLRASPCHRHLTSMRGHECLCCTILYLIIGHFYSFNFSLMNSTDQET